MSGISGGHPRDLTPKQDAMYQRQIDRIRAEEGTGEPKPSGRKLARGRTPTVDYTRAKDVGRRAPRRGTIDDDDPT